MTPAPMKLTQQPFWERAIVEAFQSSTWEGVLCMGMAAFAAWIDAKEAIDREAAQRKRATVPPPPPLEEEDDNDEEFEALYAALLLGVRLDSKPDEIRAALRRRMSEARVHPDQGGDEEAAKRLIAAKNLLIERAGYAT
jgi:hypothetical protein